MAYLDVWRSGTFLLYSCKAASESKKCHQDCLMSSAQSFYVPCLQSVAHSLSCCFPGNLYRMCHSSTRPGTSYHVTQFYQVFPHVSTASDKRWDEKAWVRGYTNTIYMYSRVLVSSLNYGLRLSKQPTQSMSKSSESKICIKNGVTSAGSDPDSPGLRSHMHIILY